MNEKENSFKNSLEEMRKKTIKILEYNYAHGYIKLDEFELRLEKAIDAELINDLKDILTDLEEIHDDTPKSRGPNVNTGEVREDESYTGILSGYKRKGKWKPARNNKIFVFLGGVDLDFSEAELAPGETVFDFFCFLGGINLIVPPGINVDLTGIPILGGLDNKLPGDYYPERPTIRLNGFAFLAGVEIKPAKKKKRRGLK